MKATDTGHISPAGFRVCHNDLVARGRAFRNMDQLIMNTDDYFMVLVYTRASYADIFAVEGATTRGIEYACQKARNKLTEYINLKY